MTAQVSRNDNAKASHPDPIWPISENLTLFLSVNVAFWLGVVVTAMAEKGGFCR